MDCARVHIYWNSKLCQSHKVLLPNIYSDFILHWQNALFIQHLGIYGIFVTIFFTVCSILSSIFTLSNPISKWLQISWPNEKKNQFRLPSTKIIHRHYVDKEHWTLWKPVDKPKKETGEQLLMILFYMIYIYIYAKRIPFNVRLTRNILQYLHLFYCLYFRSMFDNWRIIFHIHKIQIICEHFTDPQNKMSGIVVWNLERNGYISRVARKLQDIKWTYL